MIRLNKKNKLNRDSLKDLILDVYFNLESNNFSTLGMSEKPMWDEPLLGIAMGDDEYFDFLKQHIGDFHWSPIDAFKLKYHTSSDYSPSSLRVISLAFPQTEETKKSQIPETVCPSKNWIVSRGEWEPLFKQFSQRIIDSLEEYGVRAVSIDLQPEFSVVRTGPQGIASTWSHRHYAYSAGLGTFGLSDGLITEKGKAVRFTSFVVEAPLEVIPNSYTDPYEWCLFFKNGSCGKCIDRCPINAITIDEGHDKEACLEYEEYFAQHYWPKGLDRKDYILGCGLCQVGIPCQDKRP